MSDLSNFNNIYANLSESTYNARPLNFPPNSERKKEIKYDFSVNTTYRHNSGEVSFTTGGTNLPNNGIVYLKPDKTFAIDTNFVLTNYDE